MEREHSNSPHNIFVFVNEVFDKINEVFQSVNKTVLCQPDCAPKYFPEIYLDLRLQT